MRQFLQRALTMELSPSLFAIHTFGRLWSGFIKVNAHLEREHRIDGISRISIWLAGEGARLQTMGR